MRKMYLKLIDMVENFKEKFYFLNDPNDVIVEIEPYDPASTEIVRRAKTKIRKAVGSLPIHFLGSCSLKISGRRDVDLFIECPTENFCNYDKEINEIFGQPKRKKKNYLEWQLRDEGWEIDIVLIDPNTKKFKNQMLSYFVLKNNPNILEQYEYLKQQLNGTSIRRYEEIKRKFFSNIIKDL